MDKDILQLCTDPRVLVMKKNNDPNPMNGQSVIDKYGITPEQFTDYQALCGDSVDGFRGVRGVGPKTAAGLLQLYKKAELITLERVVEHMETVLISKQLAKLVDDVSIDIEMTPKPRDAKRLSDFLFEMMFNPKNFVIKRRK